MYDFVQLISAELGMHSNDFSTEKKHMPSIFLISLSKSGLFSHNMSWSSPYVGYFWATVESSSQINIIILRKERFGKKNATHWRQPFCCPFFFVGVWFWRLLLCLVQLYRLLPRVIDAQLNILQPLEGKSLLWQPAGWLSHQTAPTLTSQAAASSTSHKARWVSEKPPLESPLEKQL